MSDSGIKTVELSMSDSYLGAIDNYQLSCQLGVRINWRGSRNCLWVTLEHQLGFYDDLRLLDSRFSIDVSDSCNCNYLLPCWIIYEWQILSLSEIIVKFHIKYT